MSMLKFAEEFTRLISRYKRNSSPINDSSNDAPLTNEEILYTIRHVLHVMIEDFDDKIASDLVETSDAIAVNSLETSVANIKLEPDVEDKCRSQATQPVVTDSTVSDISLNVVKKEPEDSSNTLQNEKKLISRSNPTISRSDTFVREENQKINTKDQEDIFEDFTNTETDDLSSDLSLLVLLNEIQKSAMNIVATQNNIKQAFLQSRGLPKRDTAKVQQSSGHSNFRRTLTMNKTKVSTNINKSSVSGPSKLLAIESGNISERRRSTGGIGSSAATAEKSGKSTKVGYSVSNLNLSACNKASPGPSLEYQPKFTRNPKYAHVQSTIPKIIQKKKAQQLQKSQETTERSEVFI